MSGNEKSREGCNPSWTGIQNTHLYTKRISANPNNCKGFAAVFEEPDPRAATVARVIPADARTLKVGNALLGYRKAGPKRKTWGQVMAGQRFNELARLSTYRHRHGLALGASDAWARVLVNLALALAGSADVQTVSAIARRVRAPKLDLDLVAALCVVSFRGLMPASDIGEELEVTSCERTDCRLFRIDAIDECQADRRRRLDRERKARIRRVRFTQSKTREADKRDRARRAGGVASLRRCSRLRGETALSSRQGPQASFYPFREKVRRAQGQWWPASRIARGTSVAEGQAGSTQRESIMTKTPNAEAIEFVIAVLWISGRTVAEIAKAAGKSKGYVSGRITKSGIKRSEMTADERRDVLLTMKLERRDGGLLDRFDWIARFAANSGSGRR